MATGFVGGHVNAPDLYLVATGFLSGHVNAPDLYLVATGFFQRACQCTGSLRLGVLKAGRSTGSIPRGYRFISGNLYLICTLWPGGL